jgi:hypothetical protein
MNTGARVSTWAMLAAQNPTEGISQIGYIQRNSGTYLRYFWEWTNPPGVGGSNTSYFGTPVYDTTVTFFVREETTAGTIDVMYDGNIPPCNLDDVCSQTSYDPLEAWTGNPQNQFYAESHQPGDDIPGTSGNRTNFTIVQERNTSGWHVQGFNDAENERCYYILNQQTDSTFQVYTDPINHSC